MDLASFEEAAFKEHAKKQPAAKASGKAKAKAKAKGGNAKQVSQAVLKRPPPKPVAKAVGQDQAEKHGYHGPVKSKNGPFGCIRCRAAPNGCSACLEATFAGLRFQDRDQWKAWKMAKDGHLK